MTNAAAIGYMILAAKRLGIPPERIKQLDRAMYEVMDEISEESAERAYRKS